MNNKTCYFLGCRDTSNNINEQLTNIIEKHITEYHVTTFTVGHYGNFDRLVTGILCNTKKFYKDIELNLLAPYALDKKEEIPEGFNGIINPEGIEFVPKRYAIIYANRHMIKNSDYLIAHIQGVGSSRKLIEYAQRREKKGLMKITLV